MFIPAYQISLMECYGVGEEMEFTSGQDQVLSEAEEASIHSIYRTYNTRITHCLEWVHFRFLTRVFGY